MELINIGLGILLLILGRKLFWLFVGVVGFIAGMNLAPQFMQGQPDWLILVIAIIAGVIGAVLAIVLQRLAIGLAGFLAGGYIAVGLLEMFGVQVGQLGWLPFVVGGIIGGILMFILFDWALIILSSFAGATLIIQSLTIAQPASTIVFIVLILVGILIQAGIMQREPATPAI